MNALLDPLGRKEAKDFWCQATQIGFLKKAPLWFHCHSCCTTFQREGQENQLPLGYRRGSEHAASTDIKAAAQVLFIVNCSWWPCTVAVQPHVKVPPCLSFPEWRTPIGFCNVKDNISDKIFLASTFKLSRLLSVQSRLSFLSRHYITTNFVFHIYQKLPARKQFTGGYSS